MNEETAPASTKPQTRPLRILLVDDNEDYASSLAILLEAGGHAVTVALDGPQAIDSATGLQHDVCLLDLSLPTMNGYELARHLRQLATTQAAYMVAVSGWSQAEDKLRSLQAGFNEHLVKPVDLTQIRMILEKIATKG